MIRFRPRPLPVFAALFLAGCAATTPQAKPEWRALDLLTVDAPATAKKGQVVTVNLTARKLDACWEGANAGATVDEATKTVTLIVTEKRVAPEPCTQAITFPAAVATFTPASSGTYTIKGTQLAGKETNERKPFEKAIAVGE